MNFTIKLLDVVALLEDLPHQGLYRGQVGTVVDEYDAEFVEVEFSDLHGCTYALEAFSKSQLMILHHSALVETQWLKSQPSVQKPVLKC
ncbi:MAG: DUF4926 domain-containing protein [Microcoleus sp. PH2017_10_PVI_O_A]|uniref:DUF4926 domain-containing protein n=1 Tax=unclassified Microcoleus TaxID=2642155 RepID=UPI001E0BC20E|nr:MULTISPECIES: DUF4926 domain-containing protein [unclassified Microcoleus]MCC3404521.1 DUF4926 domain-containing protein [Microcoleus sp. PH2017_10_PVI_O_A]MCC3458589.1 DUF4926 domain-containing protein [Microcoleus sp. PH2017_11_PCY_U_A]MCC3476839.1 DUF4926 domain-containing protein [Microcoleus sp. PH2017_12_PCY_D_A]MCC3526976.1 DUF4926 domain-containing protein [Microcoleus sp. PH2017_21_RUC_O_A]MCC3540375.1 DUF4926 domain-containing protein [Microcoleus sp. PH2017_22_RUC_O_B]